LFLLSELGDFNGAGDFIPADKKLTPGGEDIDMLMLEDSCSIVFSFCYGLVER
jgi:hypothetical protein